MVTTRREFLWKSILAGSVLAVGGAESALGKGKEKKEGAKPAGTASGEKKAEKKNLSILILGGTAFLGPELVEAAQARGHTLTLFNRGKTNPQMFPDVEKLRGDRNGDLKALEGRKWDAVIDTSGYFPRQVRLSAEALKESVRQYVFISTISVYGEREAVGMDETAPLAKIPDETVEKVTGETYGALKALCEQAAEKVMPGRVTVIRPGLIVGPGDSTDRYTYWPVRVARGGEVLAPGTPKDHVQYIDVRDLAEWTIRMVERNHTGIYNAVGPKELLTMGELLEACKRASGSDARFTWVDADFLEKQQVQAWSDMPMWIPPVGDYAGAGQLSRSRAVEKGLTFRPLEVTAKDTLTWWRMLPEERQEKLKAGLSPEREAEVLKAWHARDKK